MLQTGLFTFRVQFADWIDTLCKVVQHVYKSHLHVFSVLLLRHRIPHIGWSFGKKTHFEENNQLCILNSMPHGVIVFWIFHSIRNNANKVLWIELSVELGTRKRSICKGIGPAQPSPVRNMLQHV